MTDTKKVAKKYFNFEEISSVDVCRPLIDDIVASLSSDLDKLKIEHNIFYWDGDYEFESIEAVKHHCGFKVERLSIIAKDTDDNVLHMVKLTPAGLKSINLTQKPFEMLSDISFIANKYRTSVAVNTPIEWFGFAYFTAFIFYLLGMIMKTPSMAMTAMTATAVGPVIASILYFRVTSYINLMTKAEKQIEFSKNAVNTILIAATILVPVLLSVIEQIL